jgi:hypothetical protein
MRVTEGVIKNAIRTTLASSFASFFFLNFSLSYLWYVLNILQTIIISSAMSIPISGLAKTVL